MRHYHIAVEGDNDRLHEEWLLELVEHIESKPQGSVYRAWVEKLSDRQEAAAEADADRIKRVE